MNLVKYRSDVTHVVVLKEYYRALRLPVPYFISSYVVSSAVFAWLRAAGGGTHPDAPQHPTLKTAWEIRTRPSAIINQSYTLNASDMMIIPSPSRSQRRKSHRVVNTERSSFILYIAAPYTRSRRCAHSYSLLLLIAPLPKRFASRRHSKL